VAQVAREEGYVLRPNLRKHFGGESGNPEVNEPWYKIQNIQDKTKHMGENRVINAWAVGEEGGSPIRIYATYAWLALHLDEGDIQEIEENSTPQNPKTGEILLEIFNQPVTIKRHNEN